MGGTGELCGVGIRMTWAAEGKPPLPEPLLVPVLMLPVVVLPEADVSVEGASVPASVAAGVGGGATMKARRRAAISSACTPHASK